MFVSRSVRTSGEVILDGVASMGFAGACVLALPMGACTLLTGDSVAEVCNRFKGMWADVQGNGLCWLMLYSVVVDVGFAVLIYLMFYA